LHAPAAVRTHIVSAVRVELGQAAGRITEDAICAVAARLLNG